MVCYDDYTRSYVQAGIVSWGIGCGSTLPAVYVDVARYVDWIEYQVDQHLGHSYNGVYRSAEYYEGDQEFNYCRRNPSTYPIGHHCYRPPPKYIQPTRRPRPQPGSGIQLPGYVNPQGNLNTGYVSPPSNQNTGYVAPPSNQNTGYVAPPSNQNTGYVEPHQPGNVHIGPDPYQPEPYSNTNANPGGAPY